MEKINTLRRFPQPGKVECGPAAVSVLASIYPNYAAKFNIESVIKTAGVTDTITGTDTRQLAKSVEVLSDKELVLVYKTGGIINDVRNLVGQGIPVIVDWQGSTFVGSDGGRGHYSVITAIDDNEIQMIDSLPEFTEGRTVLIQDFEKLWWDTDSILDEEGNEKIITTKGLLFIIVPCTQASDFMQKFDMLPGDKFPNR